MTAFIVVGRYPARAASRAHSVFSFVISAALARKQRDNQLHEVRFVKGAAQTTIPQEVPFFSQLPTRLVPDHKQDRTVDRHLGDRIDDRIQKAGIGLFCEQDELWAVKPDASEAFLPVSNVQSVDLMTSEKFVERP